MAASTSSRPRDTANLLAHDMSPVDPLTSHVGSGNPVYEPSTGEPRRDFKRANHIAIGHNGSLQMMEKPYKAIKDTAHNPNPRRHKLKETPEVAKSAPEFYKGKHSTPQVKTNPGSISTMFGGDVSQKRLADQKLREKEYSDANWQAIQQKRQRALEAKRNKTAEPVIDPWDNSVKLARVQDRIPRKAGASTGKMFNEGSPKSKTYVDTAFGKAGGGAPRRKDDGTLDTNRVIQFEKNIPFEGGPADSYVARHLGKGLNTRRTSSGNVKAHRIKKKDEVKPDEYFDRFMGKPAVGRTSSGNIRAHRSKTVAAFDTKSNANDFFGPSFGKKPKAKPNRSFEKQTASAANKAPETFLDRMKTIEAQTKQGKKHLSVEKDEEFAVTVARAKARAKTMPPRMPASQQQAS